MIWVDDNGFEMVFEVLSERTVSKTLSELINVSAKCVENILKDITPVKTGKLRGSVRSEATSAYEWRVVVGDVNARYAPFVFYGTRPHVIKPTNAKALKFEINGLTIFARKVLHPGTEPVPLQTYLVDSMRVLLPKIAQEILNGIQDGG
ncbi:MAG: hypothetical protein RMJ14_01795 [Nitrososphaerota archaeon]|nr:hypothetical protein [Aigarchaeota archaeon]MDW8076356.1 hypothetical protein [Nitrososphaerota archaeon]